MGASVAAYTAVHYPNAVDRLVLVDMPWKGGPALDPRMRQIQNGVTREETRELFRMLFHDKSLVTEEVVDDNLVLRLRSAFAISKILESAERGLGGITEEEMRTIKAPTLILWGKYDELLGPPERTGERLHGSVNGSRLIVIDNAGHLPQLERAGEVNQMIRHFLKTETITPTE